MLATEPLCLVFPVAASSLAAAAAASAACSAAQLISSLAPVRDQLVEVYLQDTGDDIAHASASVASQDLYSDDRRRLGHAVLPAHNRSCTVRPMTIAILVYIVLRDCLPPPGPSLKLDVFDVDPRVDHVGGDTLPAITVVKVPGEGPESDRTVRDPTETPRSGPLLDDGAPRRGGSEGIVNSLWDFLGSHDLVVLDVRYLRGGTDGV